MISDQLSVKDNSICLLTGTPSEHESIGRLAKVPIRIKNVRVIKYGAVQVSIRCHVHGILSTTNGTSCNHHILSHIATDDGSVGNEAEAFLQTKIEGREGLLPRFEGEGCDCL